MKWPPHAKNYFLLYYNKRNRTLAEMFGKMRVMTFRRWIA